MCYNMLENSYFYRFINNRLLIRSEFCETLKKYKYKIELLQ